MLQQALKSLESQIDDTSASIESLQTRISQSSDNVNYVDSEFQKIEDDYARLKLRLSAVETQLDGLRHERRNLIVSAKVGLRLTCLPLVRLLFNIVFTCVADVAPKCQPQPNRTEKLEAWKNRRRG